MVRELRESKTYHKTEMQKEMILQKLKEKGCRITAQRKLIIDIILENECSCCKEIFYKVSLMNENIGIATVYRLVNTLEEIGAISRKNMYKISYPKNCMMENACTVVLDDGTSFDLSAKAWNAVIKAGLEIYGYLKGQNVETVIIKECERKDNTC